MTSDIKTLKELQEEHPEWCFTCGKHWLKPGGIHTCHENPLLSTLIAAKREDEKEIEGLSRKLDETFCEAHRQGSDLRDQLSAAQRAHQETKRQLEEAHSMILSDQPTGQFPSTYTEALARQSQRAADAAKEE